MDGAVRPARSVLTLLAVALSLPTVATALERTHHAVIRKEVTHHGPHLGMIPAQASLAERQASKFGSLLQTLTFNSGIEAVAFSPSGNQVATGSADNAVTVWNAESGLEVRTFYYHHGKVQNIVYSADGEMILSGSKDGRAVIWDPASTLVEREFDEADPIESVGFSHSGMFVITGSDNKLAKIWDTRNNKLVCTLNGHTDAIEAVAMNPQGGTAATGSSDNSAKIWNIDKCIAAGQGFGEVVHTLLGHTGTVYSVAYSTHGKWVVTGSEDFTARIWEVAQGSTGKSLRIFGALGGGHLGHVKAVAWKPPPPGTSTWNPDHDQVLTGSADGTAKLWMAHTGELVHTFTHGGEVNSVSFSPDGTRILTGSSDGTAKIWSLANYQTSTVIKADTIVPKVITPPATPAQDPQLQDIIAARIAKDQAQ